MLWITNVSFISVFNNLKKNIYVYKTCTLYTNILKGGFLTKVLDEVSIINGNIKKLFVMF